MILRDGTERFDKALLKAVIEVNDFMFVLQLYEIIVELILIKCLLLVWQRSGGIWEKCALRGHLFFTSASGKSGDFKTGYSVARSDMNGIFVVVVLYGILLLYNST